MAGKPTREISFTLRMDNPDHLALADWIDTERGGKQRFRQLRDHIVAAMLVYIDDNGKGEKPHPDNAGSIVTITTQVRTGSLEAPATEVRTASAEAAQAMDF